MRELPDGRSTLPDSGNSTGNYISSKLTPPTQLNPVDTIQNVDLYPTASLFACRAVPFQVAIRVVHPKETIEGENREWKY